MGKRKTNYSSDWKNNTLKCQKRCFTCFLEINGGGISQVTSHSGRQLHLQREKAGQNHQSMISLNPTSVSTITKPKVVFSSKESIIKAEIL